MFADQLKEAANRPKARCNVGLLLDSLDEKERVALETILRTWSFEKASEAIKSEGSIISSKLIAKHVKDKCNCEYDRPIG
jgi:hypothetical protein